MVAKGEGVTFAFILPAPRVTGDVGQGHRGPFTAFEGIALRPSLAAILALAYNLISALSPSSLSVTTCASEWSEGRSAHFGFQPQHADHNRFWCYRTGGVPRPHIDQFEDGRRSILSRHDGCPPGDAEAPSPTITSSDGSEIVFAARPHQPWGISDDIQPHVIGWSRQPDLRGALTGRRPARMGVGTRIL